MAEMQAQAGGKQASSFVILLILSKCLPIADLSEMVLTSFCKRCIPKYGLRVSLKLSLYLL
jgi:hypothetical protein